MAEQIWVCYLNIKYKKVSDATVVSLFVKILLVMMSMLSFGDNIFYGTGFLLLNRKR